MTSLYLQQYYFSFELIKFWFSHKGCLAEETLKDKENKVEDKIHRSLYNSMVSASYLILLSSSKTPASGLIHFVITPCLQVQSDVVRKRALFYTGKITDDYLIKYETLTV